MSTKQLYEKTSEGMKEVSPLVAIEDIYSKLSDTPLEVLVSLYNHVKCEWKGSVADTRRTIPLFLRRSGLFITYNNGTKYVTEFFSAGTDQITTEGWVKDSNWTSVPDEDYISAGVKPGVGTIGYEQLSDNLKQLFREKVNVTNFPDDEDIASVDNMLKLKDREADVANFQSKGYVILRKNLRLINDVVNNILIQNMINKPNIIYEVRYDFDLNGKTIKVPDGCTLKFNGGQLHNGVIVGDNLFIDNELKTCLKNVILKGTFKNDTLYPEWFGTAGDGITDDEPILNRYILPSFRDTNIKKISFSNNHYCANTIYLQNLENKEIDFGKSTFIGNTVANGIGTVCGISGNNLYIHGGIFKPRFYRGEHNGSGADNGITIPNGKNIILDNVTVDLTEGAFRGIDIQSDDDNTIDGLIINNCTTYGGENGIDILTGHNNKIKNVIISNCNIYNAYQGILINAGWYSLTIDNITISNCNIYNSEWIGMDIRYVKDLIVSKCRVQDSQYRGISIYTSNFDIKDCFVSCKDNADAEKGIYIYDDSSASEIDLTTIFSSIDNLIVKGAFKVGFETKQDYIRVTNLYLEGYINYGIANNRKKCFYKNIFYLSDKEVYLPNYEKGYGIIIEDIYKLSIDGNNEKNSFTELPSALRLNYLGGLLIPNSDGTFYKIATRNGNLTLRNPSNEDILTLFPDKTATFGGMLRVAIDGLYFTNEDGKNPIKLGIYNGRMTFRDSVTNDILLSFDEKGLIPHSYSSDNRPQNVSEGYECYDSTLKKKILWNGTAWVNLDGTELA